MNAIYIAYVHFSLFFGLFFFYFSWHAKLDHAGNFTLGDHYGRSSLGASQDGFSVLASV